MELAFELALELVEIGIGIGIGIGFDKDQIIHIRSYINTFDNWIKQNLNYRLDYRNGLEEEI